MRATAPANWRWARHSVAGWPGCSGWLRSGHGRYCRGAVAGPGLPCSQRPAPPAASTTTTMPAAMAAGWTPPWQRHRSACHPAVVFAVRSPSSNSGPEEKAASVSGKLAPQPVQNLLPLSCGRWHCAHTCMVDSPPLKPRSPPERQLAPLIQSSVSLRRMREHCPQSLYFITLSPVNQGALPGVYLYGPRQ